MIGSMSWRELLSDPDDGEVVSAWLGGRSVRVGPRAWRLHGPLPEAPGWYRFEESGRRVSLIGPAEPDPEALVEVRQGFLLGDRFCPDEVRVPPEPAAIAAQLERAHLVPRGLDRFCRVSVGRMGPDAGLVFRSEEMPIGPEAEVAAALVDDLESVGHIAGVPPALDAAFRVESERRRQVRLRRKAAEEQAAFEALLAAEAAERAAMAHEVRDMLADGARRRAIARRDFGMAATAALRVAGAEYLDHRPGHGAHEVEVQFRLDGDRFECTCDGRTLRIIDAGICLEDHVTMERGDTYFTLESLPGVIRQARDEGALVVFRHLD